MGELRFGSRSKLVGRKVQNKCERAEQQSGKRKYEDEITFGIAEWMQKPGRDADLKLTVS